jgi:hypothetical protein
MQRKDDPREAPYSTAIRAKLVGEALRERHDLVELLGQLDVKIVANETAIATPHAESEEGIAAMACAANRKPREPGA